MSTPHPQYVFAMSYAGPDQKIANAIACLLKERGHSVFFAPYYQHEHMGRERSLYHLYRYEANYTIALVSKAYDQSKITELERDAALARELHEGAGCFLPIIIEKGYRPEWMSHMRIFYDLTTNPLSRLVDILQEIASRTPPGMMQRSVTTLNKMLASDDMQERVDALEEIARRKLVTENTICLLALQVSASDSIFKTLEADDIMYIRRAALWTIGMVNRVPEGSRANSDARGLDVLRSVLLDSAVDPELKIAAVQALQAMNRLLEPTIIQLLNVAANDKHRDVVAFAQRALRGEKIDIKD